MSKSVVLSRLSAQRVAVLVLLAAMFLYIGWFGLPDYLFSKDKTRYLEDFEYSEQIELFVAIEQSVLLATFLAIVLRQTMYAANLPLVKPTERPIQFLIAFVMAAGLIWLLFLYLLPEAVFLYELSRFGGFVIGEAVTSFIPAIVVTMILLFSSLLLLD